MYEGGDVIVQKSGQVLTIHRSRPVGEHYGNCTNYLHLCIVTGILFDAELRVPGVLFYFAEELIAAHHLGIPSSVVLQINKITVTKLLAPVR